MSALRDIINHYIRESAVTFEMVEMSLENRKTWFTQFTDNGRYQLMIAELEDQRLDMRQALDFINDQPMLHL